MDTEHHGDRHHPSSITKGESGKERRRPVRVGREPAGEGAVGWIAGVQPLGRQMECGQAKPIDSHSQGMVGLDLGDGANAAGERFADAGAFHPQEGALFIQAVDKDHGQQTGNHGEPNPSPDRPAEKKRMIRENSHNLRITTGLPWECQTFFLRRNPVTSAVATCPERGGLVRTGH
jgi:hypothetical protein